MVRVGCVGVGRAVGSETAACWWLACLDGIQGKGGGVEAMHWAPDMRVGTSCQSCMGSWASGHTLPTH